MNRTAARRAVAALLTSALLAGACARDGDRGPAGDMTYGTDPPASTTSAGGERPDDSPATTSAGTPRNPQVTAPLGTTSSQEPAVGARDERTGAERTEQQRLGAPGSYARVLLQPDPATQIAVDVIEQQGASVRSATVGLVEDTLEDVTRKPVALQRVQDAPPGDREDWDVAAITAFADRHATTAPSSSRAVIRFLVLRGRFAPEERVIGVAVRGDVFAVFVDAVNRAGSPLVPASTIEQAVAVHELGHLLGLVDIALDRNRDDPDHPHHSTNRGSVMFWAIETDLVGQVLGGPPPRSFDAADRDDLESIRRGA